MFKSNKSTNNLNVTMLGKHDLDHHQQPPFLSILTNNAHKRLSFIDKGKSWARQLLKNSNKGLNVSSNSFESCDSGIGDANFFHRGSFNNKNKFKVTQSSSCSFITSPYSSSANSSTTSSPTSSAYHSPNTPESTCTLTTSKSTSFSSESSNSSIYSSPSNSSASSSGYLMSPVDESGYLVPIVTLTNRPGSFNEKQRKPMLTNTKIRKNRLSNLIPSCSPLTRSFSTRSAYNSKPTSSFASYNPANRATICEQINSDPNHCIKCNASLNLKTTNSDGKIATTTIKANDTNNAQELNKYSQEYNLFESYTCASCSASDCNLATTTTSTCKPPLLPAPLPPTTSNNDSQRPPQIPLTQPPQKKSPIPSNPPPPLPLLPPPTLDTNLQNSILLLTNSTDQKNPTDQISEFISSDLPSNKQSGNNITITPLLLQVQENPISQTYQSNKYSILANKCLIELANQSTNSINSSETLTKSSETLENLLNLFEASVNKQPALDQSNLTKPTLGPKKVPALRKQRLVRTTSGTEPIVYIDSADLEYIAQSSSSSSISPSSSADSSNRSSLSNPNLDINMNNLIAKLKLQNNYTQYSSRKAVHNPDYHKLNYNNNNNHAHSNKEPPQNNNQQHDYHVIDEIINDSENIQNQPTTTRLTSSNSIASFDFVGPTSTTTRLIKLDTTSNNKVNDNNGYEKSWENSTVILLDKLNDKLASSLIAIANEQKKQLQTECRQTSNNQTNNNNNPVNNPKHQKCTLREKKQSMGAQQSRTSFPFREKASVTKSQSQNLANIHSYSLASSSADHSPVSISSTGSSTSSIQSHSKSNNDDLEHLLSISTSEDSRPNLTKSYTNSSNNSTSYQYSIASDIDKKELINESWYQPNLPRDNVHSCLADKEIGSFIIRLSNTCKNCYALSIRVPYFANQNGIAHYLITKNSRGFKLKGVEKEFKSLKSLVTHYSVMQEILPVTLNSMGLIALSHTSNSNDNHNLHALTEKNTNMACIY